MKQGWEIKTIGSMCDIKTGKLDANAASDNGLYPFFTCSQTPLRIDNYAYDCECVLVAGNGELNAKYYKGKFNAYQRTYIITTKETSKDVSVKYLYKFFSKYVEQLRKLSIGGVIKYIKLGNLTDATIPVPPIEEQERIVEELDCLSGVIEKKREQLKQLDALAQSFFYQMFGDPITNEKGCEVKCLRDISTIVTGATPSREKEELYYGGEIHWVKTTEVQNCDIHSTEETITQLAVEQTNCKVYPQNTLLMAMYGQGKTRGQIARLKISAATNQACAAIMLDEARCILDFIYELLLIKYESIRAMAKGGNQANLNLKIVGSIPIILPPLALQQEFTDKIEAIEKQKELIKKSISETENLFNARMDYYFN